MKVVYTPRAFKDLEDIRAYIAKDNTKAAWVVASFIRRSIRNLEILPHQGRMTDTPSVRRIVVMNYPYVVYYIVHNKRVAILHARHSAREQ